MEVGESELLSGSISSPSSFLAHQVVTKSSPSRPQVTTVVTLGTATGAWPPSAADSGPNSLATNESNDTTAPPMAGRPTVGPPPSDQKLQSLLPRALQARTSQLNCTNCRTSASAESHTSLLGLEEVNLPSFQSVQLHLGFLEKGVVGCTSAKWVARGTNSEDLTCNTDLPPGSPDTGPVSTWILLALVLTNLWHQHAVLWICHPHRGHSESLCGFGGHEVAMIGFIVKNVYTKEV